VNAASRCRRYEARRIAANNAKAAGAVRQGVLSRSLICYLILLGGWRLVGGPERGASQVRQ
jgi:hypothetical protein